MTAHLTSDPMLPQPYVVRGLLKETPDTFTLKLSPETESNVSSFQPGQFSMLWVFGVGELPISISGDPAEHSQLVYTVRSVGQATNSLVTRTLGEGVGVRGPFGAGWPLHAARNRDVIVAADAPFTDLAKFFRLVNDTLQTPMQMGTMAIIASPK